MTHAIIRRAAVSFGLAAAVALPILSMGSVAPAEARDGGRVAAGVAAGVLGGVAAGALLGGVGRPGYVVEGAPPEPIYEAPPPVRYVPSCQYVRRQVWLDPYTYTYRRERVCD